MNLQTPRTTFFSFGNRVPPSLPSPRHPIPARELLIAVVFYHCKDVDVSPQGKARSLAYPWVTIKLFTRQSLPFRVEVFSLELRSPMLSPSSFLPCPP